MTHRVSQDLEDQLKTLYMKEQRDRDAQKNTANSNRKDVEDVQDSEFKDRFTVEQTEKADRATLESGEPAARERLASRKSFADQKFKMKVEEIQQKSRDQIGYIFVDEKRERTRLVQYFLKVKERIIATGSA